MKKTFQDLWFISKKQIKECPKAAFFQIVYGLCSAFQNFPAIIFPSLIINEVLGARRIEWIIGYVFLFGFLMFLPRFILSFIVALQSSYNLRLPHCFLFDLAKKMILVDFSETERSDFLNQYQNAGNMAFSACGMIYILFISGISAVIKLITLIYIVSTLDIWVIPMVILVAIISCFFNITSTKKAIPFEKEKALPDRKATYAQELFSSQEFAKDCRAYHAAPFISRQYLEAVEEGIAVEKRRYRKMYGIRILQSTISLLQTVALYILMAIKYSMGLITVGSFTMYISVANEFYDVISNVFSLWEGVKSISMYLDEYKTFMMLPETMRKTGKDMVENEMQPPTIEFRNVSFRYPSREDYSLKNVNLTIHPGEHIAVVGENGAGKTTFIKLLMRLYDPTEGEILVNGKNSSEYDYEEYMKLFSPVFQDYQLFAYSIKENVTFDQYNQNRFERATKESGIFEKMQQLPNKEETFLRKTYEPSGVELSGGERQKVAIARAFYKDAPVAVMDEPTAALDPLAEYEIYRNIFSFSKDKTTFFISHRMGSTRFCDRIIVFVNGCIAEEGSHDFLLQSKGIYYTMYQTQASYYN